MPDGPLAETILEVSGRQPQILYIEDNRAAQLIFRRIMTGATVYTAATPKEGIAIARKQPLDLIVVDFNLTDGDALEVVAGVRTFASTSVLPIIVVSGSMDKALAGRLLQLGANDALLKTVEPARTREMVNRMLQSPYVITDSRVIGIRCFSWIRGEKCFLFSPDCKITAHGQTLEAAKNAMRLKIAKRIKELGQIRNERLVDLNITLPGE